MIGSTGQLGTDLVGLLDRTGMYAVTPLGHAQIECTSLGSVRSALEGARPDIVVNAAGYVRVDESEEHPDEAFRVNAYGALHVARVSHELNALCVYISTDYVFSGDKDVPYSEDDAPGPINVYGVSKVAGEYLVRQAGAKWLIVRVASLFGRAGARGKGGNFVETVLDRARRGEVLRVVEDIRMSPAYAYDAATAIEGLIRSQATGVYHVANGGACSWYEFARRILDIAGVAAPVEPVSSADYASRARRPRNSALTSRRLPSEAWGRSWQEALRAYLVERGHIEPAG